MDDFTYRKEHTGSMVVSNGPEYICNIAQRLFFMIPGNDDYNPNMGLDITTRANRPYQDGFRDSEYEQMIMQQFMTYTDIIPSAVVAVYQKKTLVVTMAATYNGEDFEIKISSDPKLLTTQILPKVI